MKPFPRHQGNLFCEGVPLSAIADAVGTPVYVYSQAQLLSNFEAFARDRHAPDLIGYSVKALPNLSVLRLLGEAGSGFDVVSGGELARVIVAGGDPSKVVFSGVAKTDAELAEALWAGIHCFNVESEEELWRLSQIAVRLEKTAPVALRVNPEVDAKTHPHIATALRESKFGVPIGRARRLYREAARLPGLALSGVAFHLGSQITSLRPFERALRDVRVLVASLLGDGHPIGHLDVGGGLGIRYQREVPPSPGQWLSALRTALGALPVALVVEPGRAIAGDAGALLTRVLGHKRGAGRRFLLVDAAMNDFLRPALYGAEHALEPVGKHAGRAELWDVAGPVCESADFFARRRRLAAPPPGGLLALRGAGAYGFSMASTYNSRPLPAEVLVSGGRFRVIRERAPREALWQGETA